MPDRRWRGNVIDIKIPRPPAGATAEERAAAYANALLLVENALSYFQDELSKHTEALLVQEINAKKERNRLEERLSHVEIMLEAVMRALSLDPETGQPALPAMRDKMPTADDIKEAVEAAVESAIERKTPASAFNVPNIGAMGYSPWQAPPAPIGLTSDRVKEIVETKETKDERDKLLEDAKKRADAQEKRADMFRNVIVGIAIAVGTPATIGLIYLIAKIIVGAH